MKLESDKYSTGQKALSKEEYDKLLSVITNVEDELLIKLGIATCLRREDLCNIMFSNIYIDEKTQTGRLHFREAKKDRIQREPTKIVDGKKVRGKVLRDANGNTIKTEMWRDIDLSPKTVAMIKKFVNTLSNEEKKKRVYLFSFKGRQAYNRFHSLCLKAGIDTRPIHALRATGIKFYHYEAGWTDEQIASITGDTIEVIHKHYMTPSVGEMKELINKKEII